MFKTISSLNHHDMKTFVAQSRKNAGSFYKEGLSWQSLRNSALKYYGVSQLYYKEDRADDFLIDAMLRLVGSIDLSLYPNSQSVLQMNCKRSNTIESGLQMNLEFQERSVLR